MVVIPEDQYNGLLNADRRNAQYIDSVAGNVRGQVNHFEMGEHGKVTIKPTLKKFEFYKF